MTTNSFTEKQLRVTLILSPENSNGVFPGTNSNTLIIEGLRTIANIQTVPGSVSTHADVKIYGMAPEDMNALTTVFFNRFNTVVFNNMIVEQNSGDGWTQVFSGMITEAQPEYRGAPAAYFNLNAVVGYNHKIFPVPPASYQGSVPVATILSDLAGKMGYAFENDGVTGNLSNQYLWGTLWDQLNRVCIASGTNYVVDGDTLAVYPYTKPRTNPPVITLGPQSGLAGYPTLQQWGITVTSLFNPGLVGGGRIKIVGSKVPGANGLWYATQVDHQLEAYTPGGAWFTVSRCMPTLNGTIDT